MGPPSNTFFQLVLISWMVLFSFILPPNEYSCVYDWTTLENMATLLSPILAKKIHLFRWSSLWSWWCKQAKLSNLGHRKPTRIHRKADAPKTRHCLVRILVQKHKWAIFLSKWARRGRYSQWRSLLLCWTNFCSLKLKRRILVSTGLRCVPHSRSYTRCFAPCFWRLHYQPQSWCRLATSELRFDTVGLLFVGCR